MRAVELWIPSTLVLVVGLRWLLGELHSVYGDEAQRLFDLFGGLARAQNGGLVDRFVGLYLFNETYPPVFHLLAAPFVLASVDPVFGGRVYSQVLTLLVSLVLYTVTRRVGGRLAGAVAVATLLGTPSFVDVSRHYLLEPLLTLELLGVLYFIGRYYESHRLRYLLLIAGIIAAGLLTKFNFFFYAAPLFIVPVAVECWQVANGYQRLSLLLRSGGIIVLIPLAVAGPWYLARATGPLSATRALEAVYEAGALTPGVTVDVFMRQWLVPFLWNYSTLVSILGSIAVLLYVAQPFRLRGLTSLLGPMTSSQHVVVSSAFVSVVCVSAIIAVTGHSIDPRWHVEAPYAFVATFGVLGRLRLRAPRLGGLGAAAAGALLQLITIYFVPVGKPELMRVADMGVAPLPSPIAVGSELLARDIARHEKRLGGTKPGEFVYFLFHEHRGPHMGAVDFYLRAEGAPLACPVAGFWNRAIDVENLFGAKYLIEAVAGTALVWQDPENVRYRHLVEHMPPAFRSLLVEVSDVEGRFGHFKAYYVPREKITADLVFRTIEIGRRLETVEPFKVLWDAQRVIWRARFEPVQGNVSLRGEIDELVPRLSISAGQVSSVNQPTVQGYLLRIQEIRRTTEEESRP
jgi:4-amino-4-deoxy-L-arabinose transferase-like glycosyltransferase